MSCDLHDCSVLALSPLVRLTPARSSAGHASHGLAGMHSCAAAQEVHLGDAVALAADGLGVEQAEAALLWRLEQLRLGHRVDEALRHLHMQQCLVMTVCNAALLCSLAELGAMSGIAQVWAAELLTRRTCLDLDC